MANSINFAGDTIFKDDVGIRAKNRIVRISFYRGATLYHINLTIASTRSLVANQRRDCCLSTIVDVYTSDNSSPQSPVRRNAVMTTMMDLRRDAELCLLEGPRDVYANRACALVLYK